MRLGPAKSKTFKTQTEVRQGCKLAPLLFAFHLDTIVKKLKEEIPADSFPIVSKEHWNQTKTPITGSAEILELLFADDMTFVSSSEEKLQKALNLIDSLGKKIGLRINIPKTAVMALNPKKPLSNTLSLDNLQIAQVSKFRFLGSIIASSGSLDSEIKARIKSAAIKRGQLTSVWNSNTLAREQKWESSKLQCYQFCYMLLSPGPLYTGIKTG